MVFLVVSQCRLAKSNRAHIDKVIFISCGEIKGRKEDESSNPDKVGSPFLRSPFFTQVRC